MAPSEGTEESQIELRCPIRQLPSSDQEISSPSQRQTDQPETRRTRALSERLFSSCSHCFLTNIMAGDETHQKHADESDSEVEEEIDAVPSVDIDVTKLTPLSPEVISKQVSAIRPSDRVCIDS